MKWAFEQVESAFGAVPQGHRQQAAQDEAADFICAADGYVRTG